jgi:hypothetical protein
LDFNDSVVFGRHHDLRFGYFDLVVSEYDLHRADYEYGTVDDLGLDGHRNTVRDAIDRHVANDRDSNHVSAEKCVA